MKPIRNSAKAIILHNGRFLAIRKRYGDREYCVLPGGGQEREETLAQALHRECREEINADVAIRELLFVREYIGKNHEFAQYDSDLHQVEFFFRCDVENPETVGTGPDPDARQVGVDWFELSSAADAPLYPKAIRKRIAAIAADRRDGDGIYLGDVN